MTAIFLAVGVTIRDVVSSLTNILKTTGKAMGNGLKDIPVGAKLGSMLPRLIGSIESFLFKTAWQSLSYLAKQTWLLILAAVFFIVEKYLKKRR